MNKSLKAALFSAVVYPGAGHFFLKNYKTCVAIVSIFSILLFLVVNEILSKTNLVVEKIESGEIPLDITAITEAVSRITSSTAAQEVNIKIYIMIIIWVIAILDSYKAGKTQTY
jgi:hypothetical protein